MERRGQDNTDGGSDARAGGRAPRSPKPAWFADLAAFQRSDDRIAIAQLLTTLWPYGCLLYLMVLSVQHGHPYALTLALALPAAALLVRAFILFHDCTHGSLFASRRANVVVGYLLGVLVFTSFEDWRFCHLQHHVSYANLDARGTGDVWTLTRHEYEALPRRTQWFYRFYRTPLVLIGLGAGFVFLLSNRLPTSKVRRQERVGVLLTNVLIFAVVWTAGSLVGWRTYLMVQLPVIWLAGAAGIWLFYVQHQFVGVYWAREDAWDPVRAALEGSSFYHLPQPLRWLSGNIGYHHVHHLNQRIPNYRLKACYEGVSALRAKARLTVSSGLACMRLKLWDEDRKTMVGFARPSASP